ncbi:hypothetical protein HFO32_19450 [Rhizobium leguminosarum]|uniref:hypothetical protein n=1 Tax=Rhizobium leguminosarum TaxID=384 RepID=UPI001C963B26|nr:hypothetical protein [Rhizobium leguminosarum]MBY5672127.1 hypothetical protein [Rhizobium leguminosarum]MBY5684308.1 hypothetical protein [Rhizobium leguminosarum]
MTEKAAQCRNDFRSGGREHGARTEIGACFRRDAAVEEKPSCEIPRIEADFRVKLTSALRGLKGPCAPHASRSAYEGKMSQ